MLRSHSARQRRSFWKSTDKVLLFYLDIHAKPLNFYRILARLTRSDLDRVERKCYPFNKMARNMILFSAG